MLFQSFDALLRDLGHVYLQGLGVYSLIMLLQFFGFYMDHVFSLSTAQASIKVLFPRILNYYINTWGYLFRVRLCQRGGAFFLNISYR